MTPGIVALFSADLLSRKKPCHWKMGNKHGAVTSHLTECLESVGSHVFQKNCGFDATHLFQQSNSPVRAAGAQHSSLWSSDPKARCYTQCWDIRVICSGYTGTYNPFKSWCGKLWNHIFNSVKHVTLHWLCTLNIEIYIYALNWFQKRGPIGTI